MSDTNDTQATTTETAEAPKGRRRYTPRSLRRIQAGAGWDEWFKVKTDLSMEDLFRAQRAVKREFPDFDEDEQTQMTGLFLAAGKVVDWSLTHLVPNDPANDPLADGDELSEEQIAQLYHREKLPYSVNAFRELGMEVVLPVIESLSVSGSNGDFLAPESAKQIESPSV